MSLAQLKEQAALLSDAEKREFIAFLVASRRHEDEAFRAEIARKIDDKDPSHWVDGRELEKFLDAGDQS
jgi:hypothetical protein